MADRVVHPGPRLDYDRLVVPAHASPMSLQLDSGDVLLPALARELENLSLDSAYLELHDVLVAKLDYVRPFWPSPDGRRVAWYSDTQQLTMPGTIKRLVMFVGRKDGTASVHGHGSWCGADGEEFFGHVLPDFCVLAQDCLATGFGLTGARFDVMDCAETEFSVFHPVETATLSTVNAQLMRIAPNAELGAQLSMACSDVGWDRAWVYGIGSLVAAEFSDGTRLESIASEFAIELDCDVSASAGTNLSIRIVGVEGPAQHGRLPQSGNRVLITSEMLLTTSVLRTRSKPVN